MAKIKNEDKPWIDNYPALKEWLDKIDARCADQIIDEHRAVETWIANGHVFIVTVKAKGRGWDIFTAADTIAIVKTFEDAEKRLGLRSRHEDNDE